MKKEELLELFKFYKEEKQNPFIGRDTMKAKWWEGEKALFTLVEEDKFAWQRILNNLKKGIDKGYVSGYLIDTTISIEQRVIYFYLDLWNGKNFPHDSLDDIFYYVRE